MSLNLANRAYLHHLRSDPERAMAMLSQARAIWRPAVTRPRAGWLEIANTAGAVA